MRFNIAMYAYKDWLRLMDAGVTPKTARETVESDYRLDDEEKGMLSIPMQRELDMRIECK